MDNEVYSLDHINEALDELSIPRNTEIGMPFTTWGRVSILIDRYKALTPAPLPVFETRDEAETMTFHAGDAGYSGIPETPQVNADGALRF